MCDVKPRQALLWSKFRLLSVGRGELTEMVITSDCQAETLARSPQVTVGKYMWGYAAAAAATATAAVTATVTAAAAPNSSPDLTGGGDPPQLFKTAPS